MNKVEMSALIADIFRDWTRLLKIGEEEIVFQSDGTGQSSWKQDSITQPRSMMRLKWDDYYNHWKITWKFSNDYGPEGRAWSMHVVDHHGYRDCQAVYEYACFIKEGMEREALEGVSIEITNGVFTDAELLDKKSWDVEEALKRLGVTRRLLSSPPPNQYHQMTLIIAKELGLDEEEVARILSSFRCQKCGTGFERDWLYCSECGQYTIMGE